MVRETPPVIPNPIQAHNMAILKLEMAVAVRVI